MRWLVCGCTAFHGWLHPSFIKIHRKCSWKATTMLAFNGFFRSNHAKWQRIHHFLGFSIQIIFILAKNQQNPSVGWIEGTNAGNHCFHHHVFFLQVFPFSSWLCPKNLETHRPHVQNSSHIFVFILLIIFNFRVNLHILGRSNWDNFCRSSPSQAKDLEEKAKAGRRRPKLGRFKGLVEFMVYLGVGQNPGT